MWHDMYRLWVYKFKNWYVASLFHITPTCEPLKHNSNFGSDPDSLVCMLIIILGYFTLLIDENDGLISSSLD